MEILNNLETAVEFDNGVYFKIFTAFWFYEDGKLDHGTAFEFRDSIYTNSSCLELWDNESFCWDFVVRLRNETEIEKFFYDNEVAIPYQTIIDNKDKILAVADEHFKIRTVLFNHFRK